MIWVQLAWMVVTTLISIAFDPSPPKPKAAELSDFSLPTAEEGRPIPIVFGEVEQTGPNVTLDGDLDKVPIKKRSGFSKATVGYKYFLGIQFSSCIGPVYKITKIKAGEKVAWSGSLTANTTIVIDQRNLFGGEKGEGGLHGALDVRMGGATQIADAYLESVLGAPQAGDRGTLTFVWHDEAGTGPGYIGNTAYPKPWSFTYYRILKGWQGDLPWYPAYAAVGTAMNPAHVMYQTMTDQEWGMSIPATSIDETSWQNVAQDLYAEGFGLSLILNGQTTAENFLQQVADHIAATIRLNHNTGLIELKLIRGDYDPTELEIFNEDTITTMRRYQRQGWGETINEIVLVYADPDTKKDASLAVNSLANIASQGGAVISERISYPGICDKGIASRVALRELKARSTPLAQVSFEINRAFWVYTPGDVFRLSWAAEGVEEVVFRVASAVQSELDRNMIVVEAVEDIFGMPGQSWTTIDDAPSPPGSPPIPPDSETDPEFDGSILDTNLTHPPTTPADGDSYYVPTGATGAWAGHAGEIATWDADNSVWIFNSINAPQIVWDPSIGSFIVIVGDGTTTPLPTGSGGLTDGDKGDIVVGGGGTTLIFDSAVTTAGRALIDDTSAANQRTTLGLGTAALLASDADVTLAANSDANLATQKATKTYVDNMVAGLSWKQAVRAATIAAGTLASSFENGDSIDGVTLATGDRILIKDQAAGAENGIYTVNASGAPTRASDANTGTELVNATCYVSEGTTLADTQWTCTTNRTITIGTTALAFAQLSSGSVGGLGYYGVTSTTSITVGLGTKVFTVNQAQGTNAFAVGQYARMYSTATPANYIEGLITAYSGTSLTIESTVIGGSGTIAAWTLSIAGIPGAIGPGGANVVDGAEVTSSTTQSIPDSTDTAIIFDTEVRDDGTYATLGTNNDRLTVASPGWYAVVGSLAFASNATNLRRASIQVNAGSVHYGITEGKQSTVAAATPLTTTALVYLAIGDYVRLIAYQNSGGSVSTTNGTPIVSRLSLHRLSGVSSNSMGCLVTRAATQTLATAGTDYTMSWDTEVKDDNNFWTSGTPTKITFAVAGWYAVSATVSDAAAGDDQLTVQIMKNSAAVANVDARTRSGATTSILTYHQVSTVEYFAVGDYIEIVVQARSGTNNTVYGRCGVAAVGGSVGATGATGPAASLLLGGTWVNRTGLTTPAPTIDQVVPRNCTIQKAYIVTEGGPGSCLINVWKDSYTNWPATSGDSITAGNDPVITSGGSKYRDATLTGWSTSLAADDVLRFNLASVSTFTRISIFLVIG